MTTGFVRMLAPDEEVTVRGMVVTWDKAPIVAFTVIV
jgi:hypothetical protein